MIKRAYTFILSVDSWFSVPSYMLSLQTLFGLDFSRAQCSYWGETRFCFAIGINSLCYSLFRVTFYSVMLGEWSDQVFDLLSMSIHWSSLLGIEEAHRVTGRHTLPCWDHPPSCGSAPIFVWSQFLYHIMGSFWFYLNWHAVQFTLHIVSLHERVTGCGIKD